MSERPPRYAGERSFPPYAYVPGTATPHPRKDPRGHAYGRPEPALEPLDPAACAASDDFRFAVDLYNHGFFWEAHEVLEGLWIAAGKTGRVAELLKALIKLCAAAVKVAQAMPGGVAKHLAAAERHFVRAGPLAESVRWEPASDEPGRGWLWLATPTG